MNDEQLAKIRKRAEESIGRGPDWDDFEALLDEVERLRTERRGLWRFVKPVDGALVVYVGVHAVRWYEAAGEYEPTAGFVQAYLEEPTP